MWWSLKAPCAMCDAYRMHMFRAIVLRVAPAGILLPLEHLPPLRGRRRRGGVGGGGVGEIDEVYRGISVLFDEPVGALLGQSAKQKRSQ